MKSKIILLALGTLVALALVNTATADTGTDQYGDTYISSTATTDPIDGGTLGTYSVNLGTTASQPGDITSDTTSSTDWSNVDTATDGTTSEMSSTVTFTPTGTSTTQPISTTTQPITTQPISSSSSPSTATTTSSATSPTMTAGTYGESYEYCDLYAAVMHVLNASKYWGSVSGITSVDCYGLDLVEISTTSCLERGDAPFAATWEIIVCGSKSEIGQLLQKVTHNCSYTTYAYEWRNSVAYQVDDLSNSEVASGHLNSKWVAGNHCH